MRAAARGCKVWLDQGGAGTPSQGMGLSGDLTEGHLCPWQLCPHGAGRGVGAHAHPATAGTARGGGLALRSPRGEVLPAELCRGGGSPARPPAMSWDQSPGQRVPREEERTEVPAPGSKQCGYLPQRSTDSSSLKRSRVIHKGSRMPCVHKSSVSNIFITSCPAARGACVGLSGVKQHLRALRCASPPLELAAPRPPAQPGTEAQATVPSTGTAPATSPARDRPPSAGALTACACLCSEEQ